jgi:uncharacterized protein (DUF58 family)
MGSRADVGPSRSKKHLTKIQKELAKLNQDVAPQVIASDATAVVTLCFQPIFTSQILCDRTPLGITLIA